MLETFNYPVMIPSEIPKIRYIRLTSIPSEDESKRVQKIVSDILSGKDILDVTRCIFGAYIYAFTTIGITVVREMDIFI